MAEMIALLKTVGLFVLTAGAEIFGCYTVYAWLKTNGPMWWLAPGAVSLALFAWLLTLHPSGAAGRTYAAYGGVYVATAVFWLWGVEGKSPDHWDLFGSAVSVVGMAIIMFGPRPS